MLILSIQHGGLIELIVIGADHFYFNFNNSSLLVCVKITNAEGTSLANSAIVSSESLTFHSLFCEINGMPVSELTNMYAYRAYIETLVNYY